MSKQLNIVRYGANGQIYEGPKKAIVAKMETVQLTETETVAPPERRQKRKQRFIEEEKNDE